MPCKKKAITLRCETCPQFSKGTCLIFSVNVYKYGKPKECVL